LQATLPCKVEFQEGPPAKVVKSLAGRPTMILSHVPYALHAGDAARAAHGQHAPEKARSKLNSEVSGTYAELGRIVRQHRAEWRDVFCVVGAGKEEFEQHTGLSWTIEERFLSGSSWVNLMQWNRTTRGNHT